MKSPRVMNNYHRLMYRLLALSGFCVFLTPIAVDAQSNFWTGAGADTNWTTNANWSNGVPPVSTDYVFFDDTASVKNITLNTSPAINGISYGLGTGPYTYNVTASGSQTLSIGANGISLTQQPNLFSSNGLNFNNVNFSLSASQSWAWGFVAPHFGVRGAFNINGGSINLNGYDLTVLANDGAGSTTIAAPITGTGNLSLITGLEGVNASKIDIGSAGPNTYSGNTTIQYGAVRIHGDSPFSTGTVNFSNALLAFSNSTLSNNFVGTGNSLTLYSTTSGSTLTFNGTVNFNNPFSALQVGASSGGIIGNVVNFNNTVTGNFLRLNSTLGTNNTTVNFNVANALSGQFSIESPITVGIGHNNAFGSSNLRIDGVTGTSDIAFQANGGFKFISNNITFANLNSGGFVISTRFTGVNDMFFTGALDFVNYNQSFISDSSADTSFLGNLAMSSFQMIASVTGSGDLTYGGSVSGSGLITKNGSGSGVLAFTGGTSNTNTGGLTINAGKVLFNKSGNGVVEAIAGGTITINGGTLTLGAGNQIASGVNMVLNGGIFETGGFSDTLSTLTLSANSTLDMGSGASIINYADSSGTTWAPGSILSITNWSGNAAGGGTDQLYFGSSASGLTAGQISQIVFINPLGFAPGSYGAQLLASGELTPVVPEPSTYAMGIALLGVTTYYRLRQLKKKSNIV